MSHRQANKHHKHQVGNTPQESSAPIHQRGHAASALARFFINLVGGVFSLFLIVIVAGSVGLVLAYPQLPDIDALVDYQPKMPLRIYSHDGVLIGEYGEERRLYTPIDQIPKIMQDAVLAIEDSRFYQHNGVDYVGVLRAGLAQFGSVGGQGASTITMQVARNFYLSTEKTLTRKIYEVLLALKIEHYLPKSRILEIYMNQIFLGQRAYGFAAASETYFNKPLKELSVAEAAMLAGLPKAPSLYNPFSNMKRAVARQRYIIDRMMENGFITAQQHQEALDQKIVYRRPDETPVPAQHLAETARQLIFLQYGNDAYTRGLQVYLTVSIKDQIEAYRALRKGLMDYERRQSYRGPEGFLDISGKDVISENQLGEAANEYADDDDLKAAVVLGVEPKRVSVMLLHSGEKLVLTGNNSLRQAVSGLSELADTKRRIRMGAVIRIMRVPVNGKEEWVIAQKPEVEGALIAMNPLTGEINAMVGGFGLGANKFNRATQAWRQPGSSFKPFIYSAALEYGFAPDSIVDDAPLFFDAATTGSQPWEPKNYDGSFEGAMTLRRALAKSKNMVSIRVLQEVGVERARDWITRFGFEKSKHAPYLTMALGAGSVTLTQMAVGYSVFANKGFLIDPILISRITDARGKMLHEARIRLPEESARSISARNAFLMTYMLGEVTRTGTAAKAQVQLKRTDIYGKTGTTNDAMDAWFAGFHPTLAAVVWVGYDTPRKLGSRETGGGLALPIWIDFMAYALRNTPHQELAVPAGVIRVGDDWRYSYETEAAPAPPSAASSSTAEFRVRSLQ